jgi:hypothetical protein
MLGLPGFGNRHVAVRQEINPLDKSTIFSIYPKEIIERKWTIEPGYFHIPPGTYEKPAVLVVGTSSWWKEIPEEDQLLEIPVSSISVANSVVKDYCNGLLACDMAGSMPGIFFIPGEISVEKLKKEYKKDLDLALQRQRSWYMELVKLSDALWARSNGNPLTISDDARLAARELGFSNKEWLQDFQNMELVRCVACGAMRNPMYPICRECKTVVDQDTFKKLGIKFAEQ